MSRLPGILHRLRNPYLLFATGLAVLVAFPLIAPGDAISLGFVALQYALFALGLNIVVGWTGLLDLGAAGFVAIGAYTTAILTTRFGWSPLAVLPLATIAGWLAGVILGVPTLRHRTDYFAILTLGFAELVALSIRNWPSVTRGSYGYSGIPPFHLPFLDEPLRAVPPVGFYYLVLAVLVPAFLLVKCVRASSLGRCFHVVKHDEVIGQTRGINILVVKLIAFGMSAALLSTGGYFWAVYQRSIVWTEFGVLLSCLLLVPLIVGGIGNPTGVVVGGMVIGISLEMIRRFLTWFGIPQNGRFLFFACVVIVCVHRWPNGLLPDHPGWFRRVRSRAAKSTPASSRATVGQSCSTQPLLEVQDVEKSFGGVVALDGVSLCVNERECVALIGSNGSGKTTLLNLMSGLVRPDRGQVHLCRTRIDRMPAFRIARLGIGRSFQELSVFHDIDVGDNLYVPTTIASPNDVLRSLQWFGLSNPDGDTAALSYGEKKALDLARLFVRPEAIRVALLDEPTAGLSQREAHEVVRSLRHLRETYPIAMVVVSHDVMFLESLEVDRVAVLHQGRLFREGTFHEVRNDADVRCLFWGGTGVT